MKPFSYMPMISAVALALASFTSGCSMGMPYYDQEPLVNTADWNNTSSTTLSSSASGFSCPDVANVIPNYDYNDNGTDYFTVCPSTSVAGEIEVSGATSQSSTVCVFAANYVSDSQIFVLPNPNSGSSQGLPWSQCVDTATAPAEFNFSGTSFNYVYIVEGPDQEAMTECLITSNYITCPPYSEGLIQQ